KGGRVGLPGSNTGGRAGGAGAPPRIPRRVQRERKRDLRPRAGRGAHMVIRELVADRPKDRLLLAAHQAGRWRIELLNEAHVDAVAPERRLNGICELAGGNREQSVACRNPRGGGTRTDSSRTRPTHP